ncbi:MAG: DotA/TraY family protein [Alphaproteobacteria bacterium]|nr:DotA/TraY family protein [Alphaproteobacteria bacterium]
MNRTQRLDIKPKEVLGYMLLPRVIPRIGELFGSGFGWVAYLMALVYGTVRLLPPGHPYLNPANQGRFGIRHVIIEAAGHLILRRENIDQILVFTALLSGMLLLVIQFVLLLLMLLTSPAFAAITPLPLLFTTQHPEYDIAFVLMDSVFGIPDLFKSCIAQKSCGGGGPFPSPFHTGLHEMFRFYSFAVLLVAVLVFLYYIMVVVAETANTGQPFGRRFATIWAPLRLVVALGLLVPINHGLNSGQYITLYAAKLGSGLATNGWVAFNRSLTEGGGANSLGTGDNESLVARPKAPTTGDLIGFMSIARSCKVLYEHYTSDADKEDPPGVPIKIDPYLVKNPLQAKKVSIGSPPRWDGAVPANNNSALGFYNYGDILIRFGHDGRGQSPNGNDLYPFEKGGVKPFCGDLIIHTTSASETLEGVQDIQDYYYNLVLTLWEAESEIDNFARQVLSLIQTEEGPGAVSISGYIENRLPSDIFKQNLIRKYDTALAAEVAEGYDNTYGSDVAFKIPDALLDRGWGGAGIWYNHIAEWNGALFDAVRYVPNPSKMPFVMEKVSDQRRKANMNGVPSDMYEPSLAGGQRVQLEEWEVKIAGALNNAYKYWADDTAIMPAVSPKSGGIFVDTIGAIFGIDGLFDMRKNDKIHPLAQLAAVGKSIIDNAINHLMVGLGLSFLGGLMSPYGYGDAISAISQFFTSLTTIGLAIGFLLYYILPTLPFMYFFFAVGSWIKTIFEAMVGVPLWALAHLRIDGEGLPGESAMNGYFLIFEIFIRPILTIFGLIAGIVIFTAMVRTLNGVFDIVVSNVGKYGIADNEDATGTTVIGDMFGFNRAAVDEFFYTILYALIVYIMATASFKMIDRVPQGILRWMGAGVSSFSDDRDDPTENLTRMAAFGGASVAGQAVSVLSQGANLGGQGLAGIMGLGPANTTKGRLVPGKEESPAPSGGGSPGIGRAGQAALPGGTQNPSLPGGGGSSSGVGRSGRNSRNNQN